MQPPERVTVDGNKLIVIAFSFVNIALKGIKMYIEKKYYVQWQSEYGAWPRIDVVPLLFFCAVIFESLLDSAGLYDWLFDTFQLMSILFT